MSNRKATLAAGLILVASVSGRSNAQPVPAPVSASRLVVSPIALRLDVGGTGSVKTTAYDKKGATLAADTYPVTFTLADTTVASVDAHGLVTGLKTGSTRLTVQVQDLLRDVIVRVTPANPAAKRHILVLDIEPNPILLLPTERVHPTVTAQYDDSSQAILPAATWAVFGKGAMFDSASGDIVGVSAGKAVLGVRSPDGVSASVPIDVAPAAIESLRDSVLIEEGADDTVRMVVAAQKERPLAAGLSWHATGDIVHVSDSTIGIVHAVAPGTSEIVVSGFGLSKRIPVRVYPHVTLLRFRPDPSNPVRLAVGAATTIKVEPLAADSSPIAAAPPLWSIGDTTVATFDASAHRLLARHLGHTTLECRYPNFAATKWSVDIIDGTLGIDGGTPRVLTLGVKAQVTASYRDAEHKTLGAPVAIRWASANDAVVTVDSAGVLTGHRVGRAVISGTGPAGARDSVLVYVTGRLLATRWTGERRSQLVTMSLGSPKPVALADTNQITRDGAWSPDRTRIAYVSDAGTRGDRWTVYVADADGGHAHAITALGEGFEHPTWSPDGATIAVAQGRSGHRMRLVTLTVDSTLQPPKPLGRDRLSLRWPTYDSAGSSVIALGERGDERHIYRVHADDETAITTGQGAESHPIVLKDGSLVYLADSGGASAAIQVQRASAGNVPSVLLGAHALSGLADLAISSDGQLLVVVVSKTDAAKGRPRKRSILYIVAKPGAVPVPLSPDDETNDFSDPAL